MSLYCFFNLFSICVQFRLKLSYFDSYSSLFRNVEVWWKGGNRERIAAITSVLAVSGCLPVPLTAPSRLMSGGAVWLLGWAEVIVQAFMSSIAAGSLLNLLNIQFFHSLHPIESNKPHSISPATGMDINENLRYLRLGVGNMTSNQYHDHFKPWLWLMNIFCMPPCTCLKNFWLVLVFIVKV